MRHLYLVPRAVIDAMPTIGQSQWMLTPADPSLCLLVVEQWAGHELQDRFEADPRVQELLPWNEGQPAPAVLLGARGLLAAIDATDTLGSALFKIRAGWAACRW